jgi:hypothetical protein
MLKNAFFSGAMTDRLGSIRDDLRTVPDSAGAILYEL